MSTKGGAHLRRLVVFMMSTRRLAIGAIKLESRHMNRLGKAQLEQRSELVKRLNDAKLEIEAKISDANNAIAAYNDIVGDVEIFRDDIVSEMESYYDDRSEKWQEGEKGSNYQEWKSEWENLDTSTVDEVDDPSPSLPDDLEALPEECSEI